MAQIFALPSIAVLAIVGTAAGIHLGNGTVDSINPFYYSPVPQQSFARLSPSYRGPAGQPQAGISAEEARYVLGSGCVGCRTYPEEYRPDSSWEQQQMPEGYTAASIGAPRGYRAAYEEGFETEAEAPDPALAAVQHYARYAVTEADHDVRTIEARAKLRAERAIAAREQAEALQSAGDQAAPRGTEQLIY